MKHESSIYSPALVTCDVAFRARASWQGGLLSIEAEEKREAELEIVQISDHSPTTPSFLQVEWESP